MGKPLAVDWHEVRTLALAIGPKAAAERLGVPITAVWQKSKREGWFDERRKAEAALEPAARKELIAAAHGVPVSSVSCQSAADILAKMPQTVLTLKEKRAFLRSVVATPIGEVDETSILAQKVKRRSTTNKAGETETETEVWLPDKLRALELDAKLAGELDGDGGRGQLVMVNVNLLGVELPVVEQIQSSPVAIADLADIVEQANPQV